jgi:hypothetical protein
LAGVAFHLSRRVYHCAETGLGSCDWGPGH